MRYMIAMLLYLHVQYLQMSCLGPYRLYSMETATHVPSFRAPSNLVTGSYGGQILDSISVKGGVTS